MVVGCFVMKFGNQYLPIFIQGEAKQFSDGFLAIVLGLSIRKLMLEKWKHIEGWLLALMIMWYYAFMDLTYIVLVLAFVCIAVCENSHMLQIFVGNKIFNYLGTYSYSWYLIHQMVGFSRMYYFIPLQSTNIIWLVVPISITFLMALLVQYLTNFLPRKIIV